MYRDEYAQAGFVMLQRDDVSGGKTAMQSLLYTVALIVITLIPYHAGMNSDIYLRWRVATLRRCDVSFRGAVPNRAGTGQRPPALFRLDHLSPSHSRIDGDHQGVSARLLSSFLLAAFLLAGCEKHDAVEMMQPPSTPADLQKYWKLPDFTLTERSGQPLHLGDLTGKVWVADFHLYHLSRALPDVEQPSQ